MDNLLVTGSWGEPHVTSSQQRNFHSGMLGDGQFVMKGMDLTVQDANTVKLDAGFGCMNGADVEVPPGGVTLKIDSGTQAQNRNDLVVLRYERDESGGEGAVESVEAVVIKGSPSSGEAKDPAVNSGSILDGDSPVDMPLWRIPISGLTPGKPVKLFDGFDAVRRRWLLENVFHIGFVWMSYANTSPASIVGGTWTPITGRFPYFNSSTATGGSNTHTLSVSEMPSHIHTVGLTKRLVNNLGSGSYYNITLDDDNSSKSTRSTGSGAAHNNMPAYQSLYAWRRTA